MHRHYSHNSLIILHTCAYNKLPYNDTRICMYVYPFMIRNRLQKQLIDVMQKNIDELSRTPIVKKWTILAIIEIHKIIKEKSNKLSNVFHLKTFTRNSLFFHSLILTVLYKFERKKHGLIKVFIYLTYN